MTTFAALPDAEELAALECAAWMTYSEELRGLNGQAYADAEPLAWGRLQTALRELAEARPSSTPSA